jgi:hypothetical protein
MKMTRSIGVVIGLILASAGTAVAHYNFIVPEKFRVAPGETLTIGFHAADGFPDSTLLPIRLQTPLLHNASTPVAITGLRDVGLRRVGTVKAPAGYSIITAVNPGRADTMKAAPFLQYLQEEKLTAVIESRKKLGESDKPGRERYSMYLKSIVLAGAPNDGYKRVAGLTLEIVPEKDPSQLKSGETLPVRVLFKGKPAANLQLFAAKAGAANKNVGKTDANGRVSVPISKGRWRLHSILMERITASDADWESFWTTLTLEIP